MGSWYEIKIEIKIEPIEIINACFIVIFFEGSGLSVFSGFEISFLISHISFIM